MKVANTVAYNAAWLIAQPILVGVVSIVVTALVARDFGTANYGTLLLLLSYSALFTQISNLGLRPYSVREIAANRNRAVEIVSDMLVLRLLLALLVAIVAVVVIAFVDPFSSVPLFAALFSLILFSALSGCFIDGLQGLEHMKAVATSFAVSGILVQLACLVAVYMRLGLEGIAAAYTGGALMMLAMVWYQFRRATGALTTTSPGGHHIVHLRRSWAFLLQNILGTIRGRIDLVLINGFLGAHAAGVYGSSMVLIQRLDLIQDGIATALFSRVAHLHGRSPADLMRLVRGAIKVVLVISTPIAVGLFAVSNEVIALMFGSQYVESGPILAILGVGIPFMFTGGVMFNVLRAMALEKVVFRASALATLFMVSFFVGGLLLIGVRGAAFAFVFGAAALAALLVFEYWQRVGSPWVNRDLLHIVIANSAMGVVLWLISDQHLAIKIAAAALVFAAAARVLGLVTVSMLKSMFAPEPSA